MKSIGMLILSAIILISCKTVNSSNSIGKIFPKRLTDSELIKWHLKDNEIDNIPGISLEKWYDENNKSVKSNIIVAVIDTQIDIEHEDLQGQLWKNEKEIPNNKIDDDNNGYIDDINGWNYLGTKSGNYIVWANFEYVRVIRKWKPFFEQKKHEEIHPNDLSNFKEYQRALNKFDTETKVYDNWYNSLVYAVDFFPKSKDTLKHFFPKEDYTYQQLDSLYNIYKINDKIFRQRRLDKDQDLGALIDFMRVRFELEEKTLEIVKDNYIQVDSVYHKNLSLDYNERIFIDGGTDELKNGYGTNNLNMDIKGIRKFNTHSTEVSSVIASNRENKIGINGFSNHIKIMPLTVVPSGDENDKDIALAIRYAVDNGAKVINMSFCKDFSVNKEWVFDAIKYAEKHNVLLIHCAGNDSEDVDLNPKYPSDTDFTSSTEISNNFINVGSTNHKVDSTFVSSFSNYGKRNVDLFAPGEQIYVAIPNNKYQFDSGTSLAGPMVSGTAALLWLYYPKLTVQEVKQIILESGTSYDIDVLVPGDEGKKVAFKELSKSGKVLNVYNAMKMAKEMSKLKK
jgi:subtilisin family serine protease